jgi:hypothetical protein
MHYTIKSTKLKRQITFSRPGTECIYVNLNGKGGYLGNQICRGGELMGSTIGISGDDDDLKVQEQFERICKSWWKQYCARFDADYLP